MQAIRLVNPPRISLSRPPTGALFAAIASVFILAAILIAYQFTQATDSYASQVRGQVRARTAMWAITQELLVDSRLTELDRSLRSGMVTISRYKDRPIPPIELEEITQRHWEVTGVVVIRSQVDVHGHGADRIQWSAEGAPPADLATQIRRRHMHITSPDTLAPLLHGPFDLDGRRVIVLSRGTLETVMIVIDVERLADGLDTTLEGSGSSIALLTPDLQVIFRRPEVSPPPDADADAEAEAAAITPAFPTRITIPVPLPPPLHRDQSTAFTDVSPFDGTTRFVTIRRSSNWPVLVAVTEDLDPTEQTITAQREQEMLRAGVSAAAMAILSLVIVYLLRGMVQTSTELADAVSRSEQFRQELQRREELYRLLASNSTDVIWLYHFCDEQFLYVSPAVQHLRGFTPDEAMRQTLPETLAPSSRPQIQQYLDNVSHAHAAGRPIPDFRGDIQQLRHDGSTIWVELQITAFHDDTGRCAGILGHTREVTERREMEEQMRRMAQHDTLTELPNRSLFSDRLNRALEMAQRGTSRLAVMFLDLDEFKPVNDALGHEVGDQVLRIVAKRTSAAIRSADTVGRIGGDEFLVLLPTVETPEAAESVATKICEDLCRPMECLGHTITISVSIGVAVYPDHGITDTELTHAADEAMYAAKQLGRNRVVMYTPTGGADTYQ